MQLLENVVIKDRYDVVVVGSGIGGLTAAALLAKKGLRPLVIEHHYLPGGACTTMRRQDITFDVGVAMMFGFGQTGFNPHRYIMNEIEEQIDIISHDCLYLMKIQDKNLTFWRDFERYFKELVAIFPQQRQELRNLYSHFYKLYDNMILKNEMLVPPTEMPRKESLKRFLSNPLGTLQLLPLMFKNTENIVKKFITDPEVQAFFNMLTCTYCYCDAKETPAILSGALFCDNHEGGAYYPSGSPQMLSNKLERAIEKWGGQMLYRKRVDEILINGGKAYGVRLTDGTEIRSERIVANSTIWNLYGKLIKPQHIAPKRMEWAQSFVPTFGSLAIYLGVEAEAIPEGTHPILMFVEDIHNITGNDITVYISSMDDPTLCPPGMHCVTIVQPSMVKWPRPTDPEYQSKTYKRQKHEEAEKLLDQVERHFPNLRKHIKVMDIGTPSTIERFTLKNWGAVGGPKMMMGQEMMKRLKARSDWENLYLCGDSTVMGIGIAATSMSGVGAANMVLRDLGLEEYSPRSYNQEYIHYVKGASWTPSPSPAKPITELSAPRIAKDCQHCEHPGCREACPANIETSYFARRIEASNFAGAARVVRDVNPLSEVCGYVCPAERFCEKKCHRLEFDNKPVRIKALHGWVCGHVHNNKGWRRSDITYNGRKIAIVGTGPAGLSCAHFLARLGYSVDLFEKAKKAGGILSQAVPPSRLPEEVVNREIKGLTLPNMNFKYGSALGKNFSLEDLKNTYKAVFLAPGLGSGIKRKLPGMKKAKVIDALTFLKSFRSKSKTKSEARVLVIGGGSVAADTALTAKALGAKRVTLVCLEKAKEMPALSSQVKEMKIQGVVVKNAWGPKAFTADNKLYFISCNAVLDDLGNFNPIYDDSQSLELEADQFIWATGQKIESRLASHLKTLLGRNGLISINERTMKVKGQARIFAGGDIVRGAGTVAQAVGDGRRAAQGINRMLSHVSA